MKKTILILMLCNCLAFCNFSYDLFDFVAFASKHNNVNILISDDIKKDKFNFYTTEKYPKISLKMLKNLLNSKNLTFTKYGDFYFIDEKEVKESSNFDINSTINFKLFSIDLKYGSYDDIKNLLALYDVNSTFINNSNQIYFLAPDNKIFNEVNKNLEKIDVFSNQLKLKLTIFETNLKDIKNRGSEISTYAKNLPDKSFNFFLNLITMPYTATNNITNDSKGGFYGVLNFLNENGFSKINSSPFFILRNGKKVYFSVVENIPYLIQSKEFKDNKQSLTNSYEYRDVGLKFDIIPLFLKDGSIDFTLDLTLENILNNFDNKPTISKKHLIGSYVLKRGELLILSGINQNLNYKNEFKIPLLGDIWFLGNLFQFSYNEIKQSILTIAIEIL